MIPLKSVTFEFSPSAISIFCNNSGLKLYFTALEELPDNLKPLTTLCVSLNLKSTTHHKKSPQLNISKSSGLGYA
jgi:hypothetical protein